MLKKRFKFQTKYEFDTDCFIDFSYAGDTREEFDPEIISEDIREKIVSFNMKNDISVFISEIKNLTSIFDEKTLIVTLDTTTYYAFVNYELGKLLEFKSSEKAPEGKGVISFEYWNNRFTIVNKAIPKQQVELTKETEKIAKELKILSTLRGMQKEAEKKNLLDFLLSKKTLT